MDKSLEKVVKIEKAVYPEFDEEFVQKISNKQAKSIDEFRGQIKDNYEKYYASQSTQIFESSLCYLFSLILGVYTYG